MCVADDIETVINIVEEFRTSEADGGSNEGSPSPWDVGAQTSDHSSPCTTPRKSKRNFRDILREVKVSETSLQLAVERLGDGAQGLRVLMDHISYWATEQSGEGHDVTATIMKGITDLVTAPPSKKHCSTAAPCFDAQWSASRGTGEIANQGAAYTRALRKSHIVRQRGHMRAQRHQSHSLSKCGHQSRQWRAPVNHQWLHDLDPELASENPKGFEFLFQKELRASDVSSLGRIVLPKKDAERHLPFLVVREGVSINLEDYHTGTYWTARYRFWPNNKSRMYLLENIGGFVTFHKLQEGDLLLCYRNKQGGYVIRGQKVPSHVKGFGRGLSSKGLQSRENNARAVKPASTHQYLITEGEGTTSAESSDVSSSCLSFDALDCTLGEVGDGKEFEDGYTPKQRCISVQMRDTATHWEEDMLQYGILPSYKPLLQDPSIDPDVAMLSVNVKQRYMEADHHFIGK